MPNMSSAVQLQQIKILVWKFKSEHFRIDMTSNFDWFFLDLQTCENLTDKPGKKIPCIFKKSVAIAATVFGISVLSLVIFLILVNGKKENNEQCNYTSCYIYECN